MKYSRCIIIFLFASTTVGVFYYGLRKTNGDVYKPILFTFYFLAIKFGLLTANMNLKLNQHQSNQETIHTIGQKPIYNPYVSILDDYSHSRGRIVMTNNNIQPALHYPAPSQSVANSIRAGEDNSQFIQAIWLFTAIWSVQQELVIDQSSIYPIESENVEFQKSLKVSNKSVNSLLGIDGLGTRAGFDGKLNDTILDESLLTKTSQNSKTKVTDDKLIKSILSKTPQSEISEVSLNKSLKGILNTLLTSNEFWRILAELEKPNKFTPIQITETGKSTISFRPKGLENVKDDFESRVQKQEIINKKDSKVLKSHDDHKKMVKRYSRMQNFLVSGPQFQLRDNLEDYLSKSSLPRKKTNSAQQMERTISEMRKNVRFKMTGNNLDDFGLSGNHEQLSEEQQSVELLTQNRRRKPLYSSDFLGSKYKYAKSQLVRKGLAHIDDFSSSNEGKSMDEIMMEYKTLIETRLEGSRLVWCMDGTLNYQEPAINIGLDNPDNSDNRAILSFEKNPLYKDYHFITSHLITQDAWDKFLATGNVGLSNAEREELLNQEGNAQAQAERAQSGARLFFNSLPQDLRIGYKNLRTVRTLEENLEQDSSFSLTEKEENLIKRVEKYRKYRDKFLQENPGVDINQF